MNSDDSSLTANFGKEDLNLIENLKAKYLYKSASANAGSLDEAIREGVRRMEQRAATESESGAAPPSSSASVDPPKKRVGDDVQVTICHLCQGAGARRELYGYRVMEKICGACAGRGSYVRKQGKTVKEGESPTKAALKKRPAWAQGTRERIETLRRDIEKINARMAQYEAESASLSQQLSDMEAQGDAAGRQNAVLDVIEGLRALVDRLKIDRVAREARLKRYLEPEKVEETPAADAEAAAAVAAGDEGDAPPPLTAEVSRERV